MAKDAKNSAIAVVEFLMKIAQKIEQRLQASSLFFNIIS